MERLGCCRPGTSCMHALYLPMPELPCIAKVLEQCLICAALTHNGHVNTQGASYLSGCRSAVIFHAAASQSNPLSIGMAFETLATFWKANPPPVTLPATR
jgi:hypothetical protein